MFENLKTNLFLIAAMASWGLGTVLTKDVLYDFSPSVLLPFQLLCSVVFLGIIHFFANDRLTPKEQFHSYWKVALLGVLNPGIAYALALSGLARIPASVSVVLWAVEPLFILVLAFIFIRASVERGVIVAVILATVGVLVIIGRPSGLSQWIGILLTLGAVLACAAYSIILSLMKVKDGSLRIVFVQQLAALVFTIVLMLAQLLLRGLPSVRFSMWGIGEAAIAGIFYYGVAFWMYVSGLRRSTAAKAGAFLTLIPVFGLVFSVLLLGEEVSGRQLFGSTIVVGAVASVLILPERISRRKP
jgi:drug/metabolite transporter (DMT)-like permease